jgi:transcriptional regulator with XRE-family HTH domain
MTTLAELGHQLRAMRAASGRTVASVAADAGLSVPYIANLENGRGNPTMGAVDRLAAALGSGVTVSLAAATGPASSAPQSLVRFARTGRFRRDNTQLAATLGIPADELSRRIITALAGFADAVGVDPGDAGWGRLMDALVLIVEHPIPSGRGQDWSDPAARASEAGIRQQSREMR